MPDQIVDGRRPTDGTAATYSRVSSDEQVKDGYSLDAQQQLGAERAQADNLRVPAECVYVDAGISGAKADRPAYQAMLAAAAAGAFQALYVWKFDRLGRDAEELLRARRMLEAAGVRLVSLTEGEAESTLVYGVRALVAQEEREKIAERTRLGLRAVAKDGRSTGGQPPLGYVADGERKQRRWLVDESEAAIVRHIFALYLSGLGVNRVCRVLNDEGLRTRRGAKFSARVILGVLDNPAYVGLIRLKGETFEGLHDPIISAETWQAALALRQARKTHSGGRGRPAARHLLSPLLVCANGHRMIPRTTSKGWDHYRCVRRHSYGDCPASAVSRRAVDEAILNSFTSENLDVQATKLAITETARRAASEAIALAEQADREVLQAEALRERADRLLYESKIEDDAYVRLLDRARETGEAAEAKAVRLRERAAQAEQALLAIDAEHELAERLTAARDAVTGRIESAEGTAAVRAALVSTFAKIVACRAGDDVHVEGLPDGTPMIKKGGLMLIPVPRPELLEPALMPVRLDDGSLIEIEVQRPRKAALQATEESVPGALVGDFDDLPFDLLAAALFQPIRVDAEALR
jgi:site-specific DNA recombinase